jgi:hypothetical protein
VKLNEKKFRDAIHKMNLAITKAERRAFNDWRHQLWQVNDMIVEIRHLILMQDHKRFQKCADNLQKLLNDLPILGE